MERYVTTPLGVFERGGEYRKALIENGYKDLGWMNGWNSATEHIWEQQRALEDSVEDIQWTRSGSDVTFVLHGNKVFCSVDMGD